MPLQKLYPFQGSEALRKLQWLLRISNTPLVQITIKAFTRYQLGMISLVFIITLIFTINNHAPWLRVNREVAIEFFSAVSQSLAALLGVLIVFLTVTSQLITQRRLDDYRALQSQIEQLIYLTQTLPTELDVFDETLVEVINYLVPLQMKDFPIWSTANDEMIMLEKVLAGFRDEWTGKQDQLPLIARLHLQQVLLVLNNMEEILEGFLILYNHILEMGRFVLAIARLSFLLGVSLLLLLLFGIVELQKSIPDLSLPMIVTLAVWVLIALLELISNTWFMYQNLHGPWSHLIHRWYYQPCSSKF